MRGGWWWAWTLSLVCILAYFGQSWSSGLLGGCFPVVPWVSPQRRGAISAFFLAGWAAGFGARALAWRRRWWRIFRQRWGLLTLRLLVSLWNWLFSFFWLLLVIVSFKIGVEGLFLRFWARLFKWVLDHYILASYFSNFLFVYVLWVNRRSWINSFTGIALEFLSHALEGRSDIFNSRLSGFLRHLS